MTSQDSDVQMFWSGQPTIPGPVQASDFIIPSVVVMGGNALFFLFCQWKKDNSYIDAYWGPTFTLPALGLILARYLDDSKVNPGARCWLVFTLVTIWATRLCYLTKLENSLARSHRSRFG